MAAPEHVMSDMSITECGKEYCPDDLDVLCFVVYSLIIDLYFLRDPTWLFANDYRRNTSQIALDA